MPSIDEEVLVSLYRSGKTIVLAEQNNGYLTSKIATILMKHGETVDPKKIVCVNMLSKEKAPQFVHSGTYGQLTKAFGLDSESLRSMIEAL